MSRQCEICGKTPLKSAKLTFSHKQNLPEEKMKLLVITKTVLDKKDKTEEAELVEDLVQIITVFSCKLQGRRKANTKKLIREVEKKIEETND